MRYLIPKDWDGDAWKCVVITWPDSVDWQSLLLGQLSNWARGRLWEGKSGSILAAQAVGREIWARNFPLQLCAGDVPGAATETVKVVYVSGGDASREDGEDMAIDRVWIDYTTGELVVEAGGCCINRYPIGGASLEASALDGNGEPITDPPSVFGDPAQDWTACGKATVMRDRLWSVGRAAWNNRLTPYSMADAIQSANPGYSVSMDRVTYLWVATSALSALEAVSDGDLFATKLYNDMLCWLMSRTKDGESKALSHTEWVSFLMWLDQWHVSQPDSIIDVAARLGCAAVWTWIFNVLTEDRLNQIALESVGQTFSCDDCGTVGGGAGLAYDWELNFVFPIDEQGWTQEDGDGYLAGAGWQGNNNWFSGSYMRQHAPGVSDRAGVLNYIEIGLTVTDTGGEGNDAYDFIYLKNQNTGVKTKVWGEADFRAAYAATGGAGVVWVGAVPYSVGATETIRIYNSLGIKDNGGVRHVLHWVKLRGTGTAPGDNP